MQTKKCTSILKCILPGFVIDAMRHRNLLKCMVLYRRTGKDATKPRILGLLGHSGTEAKPSDHIGVERGTAMN